MVRRLHQVIALVVAAPAAEHLQRAHLGGELVAEIELEQELGGLMDQARGGEELVTAGGQGRPIGARVLDQVIAELAEREGVVVVGHRPSPFVRS